MRNLGLVRIDYLGTAPGMWCLHPPQKPFPGYFDQLPQLIKWVETGDIPEGQRGYYDINESMRLKA
jgi:hypothetical protein